MKYVGVIVAALVAACAHNSTVRVEKVSPLSPSRIVLSIPPPYYDDGGAETWNGYWVMEPSSGEAGGAPYVAIVLTNDGDTIGSDARAVVLNARFLKVNGMAWTYRVATYRDGSAVDILVLFNGASDVIGWPCRVTECAPRTQYPQKVDICAASVCGELRQFKCAAAEEKA